MTSPILSAEGLVKRYGGVVALDGVSIQVEPRQIHGVIGPNGAGKSTLIGLLAGAIKPTRGSIFLSGANVTGRRVHSICRAGLGRTFQIPRPFDDMTVLETVRVAARYGGRGKLREEDVLERCGIRALSKVPSKELGHAHLRRLEVARALATQPSVLLLDEVGAGLNDAEIASLDRLIREIRDEGVAILMVEHILSLVLSISDVVTVLNEGRLLSSGTPDFISHDPAVISAYLGESR